MRSEKPSIKALRRLLVQDSIERARWMTRLLQLVREDERNRVLAITDKARERAGTRGD